MPCKDYCKANSDCPGSYCQGGLCHGSTCQEHSTCNATCSSDTPDALLGVWRGVQMQVTFSLFFITFVTGEIFVSKRRVHPFLTPPPHGTGQYCE